MTELVKCPKCDGTGTIKIYPEDKDDIKLGFFDTLFEKVGNNIDKFAYLFEDKPYWRKTTYKTCPVCRGFGMIRKPN